MSQREGDQRVDGGNDIVGRPMQDVRSEQQEQGINDPRDHEHATDLKSDDHYQSFDVGQGCPQTTGPSGAAPLPRAIPAGGKRTSSNQMSRFDTCSAFFSMNSRRGSTASPISVVKISSAATASSMRTCSSRRVSGLMVVSQSCSGFISPSPL